MYELRNISHGEIEKTVVKTDRYWIVMSDGTKLLDMQSGNSAYTLGYNNTEIIEAMNDKLKNVTFIRGNTGETEADTKAMAQFAMNAGKFDVLAWAISGSSAVEAAIHMNDLYWKRVNPEKELIITMAPGYHGTTHLTRAMGNPYAMEFPHNRIRSVNAPTWQFYTEREKAEKTSLELLVKRFERDSKTIGAFVMETCPWIHGILPYSENWWKTVRELCTRYNINMITDDVAICWGKSLSYFGYSTAGYNIKPDITAIGKALTAGYAPHGAALGNERIGSVLKVNEWEWGHTWQPNMAGIGAMKKVKEIIERDNLFEKGKNIVEKLTLIGEELKADGFVTNMRASGLFLALDTKVGLGFQSISNFVKAGLTATTTQTGAIKIICNLLADDEYFFELRKRLRVFFEKQ
jgi:adenosylmethionine-8-amino-7-oxononanoate aminotransferase